MQQKSSTLNNTVKHYLETIHVESSGITCPACGSILGMKRQGSTEMVLTENARLELDGYIASYRRNLETHSVILTTGILHSPIPRTLNWVLGAGMFPNTQSRSAHSSLTVVSHIKEALDREVIFQCYAQVFLGIQKNYATTKNFCSKSTNSKFLLKEKSNLKLMLINIFNIILLVIEHVFLFMLNYIVMPHQFAIRKRGRLEATHLNLNGWSNVTTILACPISSRTTVMYEKVYLLFK
ncbi:hypothetical protein G7B40_035555 [Aetokthonos hydrillicola Thurmond2011]|jgi:hypothetical protein|uniref:Uncharacterized protein n=1 Tax=Aetokthonos hydrillicola Thurmond2011 TaxID=2712845 RepID=A0AAP5IHQ2_9CYAN|nr:hypothetical protein [Aetokthonos hydrillicola]MBO3464051.1 hypothetical protein [Aetokthonos hydrillicola CCALA 1050]MBW4590703.1 hypothetical protein [Aetokthonos hydrillicola CCALA 1050]MDR9899835.1 hypothetical protein [Aetokthonos hydrillicola Thurmond2011]